MNPPRAFPTESDDFMDQGCLENVPADVSRLALEPDQQMPFTTIHLRFSPVYFHTRLQSDYPQAAYEDYLMSETHSAKMQAHQRVQAEKLVKRHEGTPASFVEIGCGDGSFMRHMLAMVPRVLGIEPSRTAAAEARKHGLEVIEGFMGGQGLLTQEKFDLFASREVFEHLPDPLGALANIRKMLQPGAVGLIEVPNSPRALRLGRFYEFFPDHVQYYSVNSLVGLATQAGLNVIECIESFGGEYLELWLRNEPLLASRFDALRRHRDLVCHAVVETMRRLVANGEGPIAVWGCGIKTLCIFSAVHPHLSRLVTCVIDNDPHKHGRYVPNSPIPVVAPGQAAQFAPRVVFVLALSYREEIARDVRLKVPSCRLILSLDDKGEIVAL